jgi:hypothetical protein
MAGQQSPGNLYASLRRNLERRNILGERSATIPVYQSAPNPPNVQYVGSTKYAAITAWSALKAYLVGNITRQTSPAVGSERCFICIFPGTSLAGEPTWVLNKGSLTYEDASGATPIWQEITGQALYGWTAPHARLVNALTAPWAGAAAGDVVYVSNNHAETQASSIATPAFGTAAKPVIVLCVNDAGSVPPVDADLTTGATISTTGNSNIVIGTLACFGYFYGVAFSAGSGANAPSISFTATAAAWLRLENCKIIFGGTTGGSIIIGNNNNSLAEFINTTVKFSNAVGGFSFVRGGFRWLNTPSAIDASGTIPTVLFSSSFAAAGTIYVDGVDLSALVAGSSIISMAGVAQFDQVVFSNCKLASGVSLTTGASPGQFAYIVNFINCDSANTNYRYFKQSYQGTIQQETTVVRTGGATDGTTPVSRKMTSSANSQFFSPLESDPVTFWNETVGPITVTIPIVVDAGGNPALKANGLTNADVWIEVEYPGTSGFPLGVFDTDSRAANLLTVPTPQPLDVSSTWANALAAPVQQSLTSTFTPTGKGPVRVKVMLARPSTTVYFDPQAVVSTGRTWMLPGGQVNEGDDPTQAQVQSGVSYNRGDATGVFAGGGGGFVFGG